MTLIEWGIAIAVLCFLALVIAHYLAMRRGIF